MLKRQANKKAQTLLRSWRGFEKGDWQERLEIDHKDYMPQGKLAAVYGVQTKPHSLFMSKLFPCKKCWA